MQWYGKMPQNNVNIWLFFFYAKPLRRNWLGFIQYGNVGAYKNRKGTRDSGSAWE